MRLAILARHVAVRLGLAAMVESPEVEIAASGGSVEELIPFLHSVDVLIFDFLEEAWPAVWEAVSGEDVAIVLLGSDHMPFFGEPEARGWAILSREATGPEIVAAAGAALQGLLVFDPSTVPQPVSVDLGEPAGMTEREIEILQLMSDGLPNKQIAIALGISIHTVKFHVASILRKLAASSRTEAVSAGMRRGLIRL
jgi:DNA-binding NarL/FixJ family response regulator